METKSLSLDIVADTLCRFDTDLKILVLFLLFPQGFETFREDKTLCDVVLIPGDSEETFLVHRVIMASSSDYFKAMFTGEFTCCYLSRHILSAEEDKVRSC